MALNHDKNDFSFNDKLNDFLQKNRKGMVVCLALILAAVAVFVVFSAVTENTNEKALSKVEDFIRRYEALRIFITSENPEDAAKKADVETLIQDLAAFESRATGYAAARAYALSAGIYGDQKNWAEAEKAWLDAAKAGAKTYFEPIALFNAASTMEEQGNLAAAVETYNQILRSFSDTFPQAARVQFAVGRLQEEQGSKDAALEAYKALIGKWPSDPVWSNLAHDRILVLE
ncbi:MAG: tetratricopeptide repeat protein [Treponema sp.]|jgi:tetratricopeptide (TPR) repeat protein|nr:tetratricopeptide repeat protein [Treponema sp.]